ncbi:MAG: peptidylprolyl isomerase [Anaerolineaceae bacterium]
MAKEISEKTPKELTKKHLARVEKERRQKKIVLYGIIAVVVVIVGLIVFGVLNNTVLKDNKPVAKVGKTTITVKQFENRVRYDRYQQIQTFQTYAASYFASFFQDQLVSMQNQLDNYVQFGSDTLDVMINEAAVLQKAESMGITVTDADVETYIQSQLLYYPSGTPTVVVPSPTITYYPTSTLSALQQSLAFHTPTATEVIAATPVFTETATAEGTLTGTSESPAATATLEPPTATVEITPTETATITPTPTEYTLQGYQDLYATIVANTAANASFSEAELRAYIRSYLIQQKVYDQVVAKVANEQDMVWARHILVATQAEADDIETQLKNGADWTELAAKYSTDTSNNTTGGDLGWFSSGTMVKAFEDAAWPLAIGAISDPVQTDYGFHIIQVLGHEKRQLTADELTQAQKSAYKQFITDAKTELGVKKYDVWASVVPTDPTIPDQYRISTAATTTP